MTELTSPTIAASPRTSAEYLLPRHSQRSQRAYDRTPLYHRECHSVVDQERADDKSKQTYHEKVLIERYGQLLDGVGTRRGVTTVVSGGSAATTRSRRSRPLLAREAR